MSDSAVLRIHARNLQAFYGLSEDLLRENAGVFIWDHLNRIADKLEQDENITTPLSPSVA